MNQYETYINGSSTNDKDSRSITVSSSVNTNVIDLTNRREGVVPTGSALRIVINILLVIIITFGVTVVILRVFNSKILAKK